MSRPPKSHEAAPRRSIRLTNAEWREYQRRGGTDWLRNQLREKKS